MFLNLTCISQMNWQFLLKKNFFWYLIKHIFLMILNIGKFYSNFGLLCVFFKLINHEIRHQNGCNVSRECSWISLINHVYFLQTTIGLNLCIINEYKLYNIVCYSTAEWKWHHILMRHEYKLFLKPHVCEMF